MCPCSALNISIHNSNSLYTLFNNLVKRYEMSDNEKSVCYI